jgi:zinc transporter
MGNPTRTIVESLPPGVISSYVFKPGEPPRGCADPFEVLARDETGFAWVHVNLADRHSLAAIAAAGLPPAAEARFTTWDAVDDVELLGDVLVGLVIDLVVNFENVEEGEDQLHFVIGSRLLLTGRRHALRSVERLRAWLGESQPAIASPSALFEALVDIEVRDLTARSNQCVRELERVEDRVLAGGATDDRTKLGELRRGAVKLHRQAARLVGLFYRMEQIEAAGEIHRACARRLRLRLEAVHRDLHNVQERAKLLQDEVSSTLAEQTNRSLFIISVLTAVFLPATLVTGAFGMNVKDLPFTDEPAGFWWAMAIATAGSVVVVWALRRLGVRS